jgi:SAM-dependent methyltransferase
VTAPPPLRCPESGRPLRPDGPHALAGGARRWPVVDGIPYLRAGRRELADEALAALDAGDRPAALALLLADQDDWARTPRPEREALLELVRDADRLSFRDAMDRLVLGEVATYFAHRWSDPTFLAGLALVEAHRGQARRAFEVACGAGHHLRELLRVGLAAAGGDVVFAKLWLARHWGAPRAALLCFDAAHPWPLGDSTADLVACHDAFYFLPDKPFVAAEMRRVAGPAGTALVSHAHNRLVENLSAGDPLGPEGYDALFAPALLYDDAELTRALVEARVPVAAATLDELAAAGAVALAATGQLAERVVGGVAMPTRGARLVRNPLYHASGDGAGPARVRWPSARYEAEYAAAATYPPEVEAPETATMGESAVVDALARRRVLLDLPARW